MSGGTEGAAAGQPLDHAAIRSIVLGIMLAMFLAALDQTIVATALPTIGRELRDPQHLPWVVTVYLLASTAATPLYGKLADIHGRRVMLLTGIGTFVAGSIACALSPDMLALIFARALQGLGGGGLISLAQTIIGDVIAPRERGRYQAYIAAVFVGSSIAGPVLGGVISEHLHWSVIFWINLPLGLLAFWMTNGVLRRLPRHERPHRLDLLGAVLMVGATVQFLLALSLGGVRLPWSSLPILALFAGSVLVWGLFVLRLSTAAEPLLPLSVVRNPVVAAGTGTACFAMGTFIGLSVYVPIWLQTVQGLTVSASGLAVIALMGGTVTGATASGRVMMHVRHYRRMPVAGLVMAAVALAILASRPSGLSLVVIELLLLAIGLGLGTVLPVTTVGIQNAVPVHQLGTATATMNFFRALGGAIMVAAYGAILAGHAGDGQLADLPGLLAGFRWIFMAGSLGLLAALLCLLRMEERPLRGTVRSDDDQS
ncbi:MAG TPA: MDR family MFS transporter [Geminicoccaceae bacterium]|nr:MDR family MFS transporter [Geminicoccus sp.]HMU51502.1 MDR family MFS transporter [Geminicoccaceae bacterium]